MSITRNDCFSWPLKVYFFKWTCCDPDRQSSQGWLEPSLLNTTCAVSYHSSHFLRLLTHQIPLTSCFLHCMNRASLLPLTAHLSRKNLFACLGKVIEFSIKLDLVQGLFQGPGLSFLIPCLCSAANYCGWFRCCSVSLLSFNSRLSFSVLKMEKCWNLDLFEKPVVTRPIRWIFLSDLKALILAKNSHWLRDHPWEHSALNHASPSKP